jgi:hypothetical protein
MHNFGGPLVQPVEQEFKRAMGLAAKYDFWTIHDKLSFTDSRFNQGNTSLQVMLPPSPTTPQRGTAFEPGYRADSLELGFGLKLENWASVEHHIGSLIHPECQGMACIQPHLEDGAWDKDLASREGLFCPIL